MFYLGLSILGVIILVALAIRRLPMLRHSRLGMEIQAPRPYITNTSIWSVYWSKIVTWAQSFFQKRDYRSMIAPPQFTRPGVKSTPPTDDETDFGVAATAHPGDFWQEEVMPPSDTFNLPEKGLITRRGESQKIAHELMTQADASFRKKDYKEAEKFYLQAAAKDPENARIYNRLGVIYLQTKNYRDAVEAFRRALRFDDRVASRHFNLALAYLGKKDYRSAERGLREALRLDPTNDKYRKTFEAIREHAH
jgi:tetratricopeptide (TPR) repeat protein